MTAVCSSPKDHALALARAALQAFLHGGCTLDLPASDAPQVSVLLLVCNRAELTLACLQALALRLNQTPLEIIVVDNGSTDETGRLLPRIGGLKVLRNETNLGFPRAVNQAARAARGQYLLLLNNDAEVLGRGIDAAAEFLRDNPDVGAVGGKILLLDGTLQEAGCTLRRDGSALQYGRGKPPDEPAYNFRRDIHYCSGAFLMTPRELFAQLGGLEEAFSPGYYEDPDYCIRLWQAGRRVVYLPEVVLLHYENATAGTLFSVPEQVRRNQGIFLARHAAWLQTRPPAWWPALLQRGVDSLELNVLLLADGLVEGLPAQRAAARLQGLVGRMQALGAFVSVSLAEAAWAGLKGVLQGLPRTVEVLRPCGQEDGDQLLAARASYYDLVVAADAVRLRSLLPWAPEKPRGAVWRQGHLTLVGGPEAPDWAAATRAA
jgi:GT2 family glycosyltransferase